MIGNPLVAGSVELTALPDLLSAGEGLAFVPFPRTSSPLWPYGFRGLGFSGFELSISALSSQTF